MDKNTIVIRYKNDIVHTFKRNEVRNFGELKKWVDSLMNGRECDLTIIIKYSGREKITIVDKSEIRDLEILETRQIDIS
ncbi:hypothetical protein CHF27_003910 [Romboutsia maritimum]|uniref:Uncharacterized protein n=1 Tax=Romboutsia maritimum TaxID=2020948 RepID=A0A371IUT0_9FIRM|nr:hypothetical protein [Romboutsia maritimum]RDY24234.1 hypothetical protein CHF27_003910 [Romboutsia maritimum]